MTAFIVISIISVVMIYVISICGAVIVMTDRDIEPNFFSIILIIVPIVNTIIALKYSKQNFSDIFRKLKRDID